VPCFPRARVEASTSTCVVEAGLSGRVNEHLRSASGDRSRTRLPNDASFRRLGAVAPCLVSNSCAS
jgi:hypothetical protein